MNKIKLEDVSSKYGAPMGRRDNATEPDTEGPFQLQRMRWVDHDYDEGGAYWGQNGCNHMYVAQADGMEEVQRCFVRGQNRAEAKAEVRKIFKKARFYRWVNTEESESEM